MAQALALCCPLNYPGDIGHHKTPVIPVLHDTEVRFKGGEFIIGYLGFGRSKRRQQG